MLKHALFAVAAALIPWAAHADSTGDEKLACEAILCLSTGKPPHQCQPPLKRYYDIQKKKWSDTTKARRNFLNKCPTANEDNDMKALVSAISQGAGKCDVSSLNNNRLYIYNDSYMPAVSNVLPSTCKTLFAHKNTDFVTTQAVYVGVPERGGFWVEPENYASALAKYKARIEEEDKMSMYGSGGN